MMCALEDDGQQVVDDVRDAANGAEGASQPRGPGRGPSAAFAQCLTGAHDMTGDTHESMLAHQESQGTHGSSFA